MASSVPCFLSSKVWMARSALRAASEGAFAAILPIASTATPLPVKKVLPGVLVVAGPVNELKTSTGLVGPAASSPARDLRAFLANCVDVQPPMATIDLPALTLFQHVPIAASSTPLDAPVLD